METIESYVATTPDEKGGFKLIALENLTNLNGDYQDAILKLFYDKIKDQYSKNPPIGAVFYLKTCSYGKPCPSEIKEFKRKKL